jgi:hypothetical protein
MTSMIMGLLRTPKLVLSSEEIYELFMSDIINMGPLYVGHICGKLHTCLHKFLGDFFQPMSGGVSTVGAEGTLFVSTFL